MEKNLRHIQHLPLTLFGEVHQATSWTALEHSTQKAVGKALADNYSADTFTPLGELALARLWWGNWTLPHLEDFTNAPLLSNLGPHYSFDTLLTENGKLLAEPYRAGKIGGNGDGVNENDGDGQYYDDFDTFFNLADTATEVLDESVPIYMEGLPDEWAALNTQWLTYLQDFAAQGKVSFFSMLPEPVSQDMSDLIETVWTSLGIENITVESRAADWNDTDGDLWGYDLSNIATEDGKFIMNATGLPVPGMGLARMGSTLIRSVGKVAGAIGLLAVADEVVEEVTDGDGEGGIIDNATDAVRSVAWSAAIPILALLALVVVWTRRK